MNGQSADRLADALIDSQAADTLIAWEDWVTGSIDAAVDEAVAVHGFTAAALTAAARAVVGLIGQAAAAAMQVGRAIVASAYALLTGRRPVVPRRVILPSSPPGLTFAQRTEQIAAAAAEAINTGADPQGTVRTATVHMQAVGATSVNQAAAAGSQAAAQGLGADGVMWVAERDGCLGCVALSGKVAPSGRGFDPSITFGDRPIAWEGFSGQPPRHPRCRCRVVAWFSGDDAVSEALQREARRSVLRGWSLDSESEAARLRAAERLLREGADLPVSVERYAEEAITLGAFPQGREFPG